jgi:hypothetical protein
MNTPWFLGNSSAWSMQSNWAFASNFLPLVLWSAAWTGMVLWHASKRDEKGWFIFFLFVHTAGILEILYLIFVAQAFQKAKPTTKKRKRS